MPNTDKTILLPQLQRYDQKIKGWVNGRQYKVESVSLEVNFKDGHWEVLYNLTFKELLSLFDGYTRVYAVINSGTTSLSYISNVIVELFRNGNVVASESFTIQKFVESSNPSNERMINTIPYAITIRENHSSMASGNYSRQYVDATEFTNTGNEDSAKLSLKDGGITTAKIADGAITKAKLASDVGVGGDDVVTITFDGVEADKTWDEVDALYKAGKKLQVIDNTKDSNQPYILPLTHIEFMGNNQYVFSAPDGNGIQKTVEFYKDPDPSWSAPEVFGSDRYHEYPTATATKAGIVKVGNGLSVTNDGVLSASGAGGGVELTDVTKVAASSTNVGLSDGNSVRFITGDFYCYIISYYLKSTKTGSKVQWQMKDADGNFILLNSMGTNEYFQNITPMESVSGTWDYRTIMGFVPRSTSAQAALATLLPVQDECEQMKTEVAKLEQDWIDHPDETVAVDGNGVPITIATKKTELEKKQAELEKLREDYFSKLGDWKNEVQE